MEVAKRQRRETPAKIEQRKVEWEPQVKQTSPIYIGAVLERAEKT